MRGAIKIIVSSLTVVMALLFWSSAGEACRYWAAVGNNIPKRMVMVNLLRAPEALKNLGEEYSDGWSVGYFKDSEFEVRRGDQSVSLDAEYDKAVDEFSALRPSIIMAHLRRASSGCVEGVPNPHPFERDHLGKKWFFGHNGGISKDVLTQLIGEKYLKANPPAVCTDHAPESWIDSELFFILILKHIEKNNGRVEEGILAGLNDLYASVEEDQRYFNFFLTDGDRMWAFRKGNTLFYWYNQTRRVSIITSTIPHEDKAAWTEFPEDTLAVMTKTEAIKFIPMDQ